MHHRCHLWVSPHMIDFIYYFRVLTQKRKIRRFFGTFFVQMIVYISRRSKARQNANKRQIWGIS